MGGCQTDGPLLSTLNIWCRIIKGAQKGTTFLTTTQMENQMENGMEATVPCIREILNVGYDYEAGDFGIQVYCIAFSRSGLGYECVCA